MRHSVPLRALGLVLAAILTLALAGGSVARPAPEVSDPRMQAMLLMGAGLADFCNTEDQHPHHATCSLCHLVAPCDLPAMDAVARAERAMRVAVIRPLVLRAALHSRDPAVPPRGPPTAA